MASQPWRNRLIEALRRQALPRAYIQRLVEELSDHAADLSLEQQSMEAQLDLDTLLGSPGQLAAVATREFQRRTFAGRHPVLTFLAGPFVAVIITLLATLLLLVSCYWLLDVALGGSLLANEELNLPPSPFETSVMQSGSLVVRFVPFALSAWLFAALGRRCARPVWGVVACGIITLLAISFLSVVTPPGSHDNLGTWMISFGWRPLRLAQAPQAAVPLALLAWMLWPLLNRGRIQPPPLARASG